MFEDLARDLNDVRELNSVNLFPTIKHKKLISDANLLGWSIGYYQEFESCFIDENQNIINELDDKLLKIIPQFNSDFKHSITLNSTPFLVVILYTKKKIVFYCSRLSYELFLIQEFKKNTDENRFFADYTKEKNYQDFEQYIAHILNLNLSHTLLPIDIITHEITTSTLFDISDVIHLLKFESENSNDMQQKLNEISQHLLQKISNYKPALFERLTDMGLGIVADYALVRIHMLKFLAMLPSLDHDIKGGEVKSRLLEALRGLINDSARAKIKKHRGQNKALSRILAICFNFTLIIAGWIPAALLAKIIRLVVKLVATRFIAGESIEEAGVSLLRIFNSDRDITLDQLGELVVSEREADHYLNRVLKLINGFSQHVTQGKRNDAGILKAHVSIKVSALCSDFCAESFDYSYALVAPRLIKILREAKKNSVFINIDAEHYHYRDIVLKIYSKVLLDTVDLFDFKDTGIVIQAYLRDAFTHFQDILDLAQKRNLMMPVRLVKGAYWDAETIEADAHGYTAPEFLNKDETDCHFRQLIVMIFKSSPHLQLCLASHNIADHCYARAVRAIYFKDIAEIEHQCLHMTYEALSIAMANSGWPTRNYVPIGGLLVGMAYLVRRIMENSSQVGVLTIMRSHKGGLSTLSPYQSLKNKLIEAKVNHDPLTANLSEEFINVSPVRTYIDNDKLVIENALRLAKNEFNKVYGQISAGNLISITSPSDVDQVVGKIYFNNIADAEQSVSNIKNSFNTGVWSQAAQFVRSAIFAKAAGQMLAQRPQLCALIVYESGKTIQEALADVDEAIDFINFYARVDLLGSNKNTSLGPIGPTLIISPWNFPLAIPCGMVAGALISGNSVILKSAEQTPLIAEVMVDIFHLSGVPKDVLIHLPGIGEEIGAHLVAHKDIACIAFTGSQAVGQWIYQSASKRSYFDVRSGRHNPIKVMTEMGGKNALIVTANAELDETVDGILYSAFAHAGQKCSALSRIIVHHSQKNKLVERLTEAILDLKIGPSDNWETKVNPVITAADQDRLRKQVIQAKNNAIKSGGIIHVDRSQEGACGLCVGPSLIEIPYAQALKSESFAQIELFGPVLHIISYQDKEQAIKLLNSSSYGLTGGIITQSLDDVNWFCSRMEVGNIYVNRSITGARVAIEPFGGFKMSGTGPNAGSKEYCDFFKVETTAPVNKGAANLVLAGADYEFDLKVASTLNPDRRIKKIRGAIDLILKDFDYFFPGIQISEKEQLKSFKKWLKKSGVTFLVKKHWNRRIPGQLSYDDYTLIRQRVLCISSFEKPNFSILIQVLAALAMGCGVSIAATNESAFLWWNGIIKSILNSGISSVNIDVFFSSKNCVMAQLRTGNADLVLFNGQYFDPEFNILEELFLDKNNNKIQKIICDNDINLADDFKKLCRQFILIRSMAVNTMRHGAPLSLDI